MDSAADGEAACAAQEEPTLRGAPPVARERCRCTPASAPGQGRCRSCGW